MKFIHFESYRKFKLNDFKTMELNKTNGYNENKLLYIDSMKKVNN